MKWSTAKKRHRRLIRILGGKCEICGTTRCLSIDHPKGRTVSNRDPSHRRKSFHRRVIEYWLEYADGKHLRVLCCKDNGRDGGGRRIKCQEQ